MNSVGPVRRDTPEPKLGFTLGRAPAMAARLWRTWFGVLVLALRLALLRLAYRLAIIPSYPAPRILRQFLERLGGGWIKLGQILAMRMDLLPPAYIAALSSLLDDVPPFEDSVARAIIADELGGPPEEIFAYFPPTVLAAASFGQVYRATLKTGETVAVKVQRPGLLPLLSADIFALKWFARFVDFFELFGSLRIGPQVRQLHTILEEEVDYRREAANIRDALSATMTLPIVQIPGVHDSYSTLRVLTMDFIEGLSVNDILSALRTRDHSKLDAWKRDGLDMALVAKRVFLIGLRQIFEVGTFHADPHAANVYVTRGNVVAYIDFGIVGTIDERTRSSQERYFCALKDRCIEDAVHAVREMILVPQARRGALPAFEAELSLQLREWVKALEDPEASLHDKSAGKLLIGNISLIRRHGLGLTDNALRYYRAMIISDMIILQLDPKFDVLRTLRLYFSRRSMRELRRWQDPIHARRLARDYADLFVDGPTNIRRLLYDFHLRSQQFDTSVSRFIAITRSVGTAAGWAAVLLSVAGLLSPVVDVPALVGIALPAWWDWRWPALGFAGVWVAARLARE